MNRLLTTEYFLHHSVTPQSWDKRKTVDLILASHKQRGLAYDNRISYHFLVGKDWVHVCRPLETVGYHAGSWPHNLVSVAICLVGNFNVDKPTKYQVDKTIELIGQLRAKYPNIKPKLHRDVRATACPGLNITTEIVNEWHNHGKINNMTEIQKLQEEVRKLNFEIGVITPERDAVTALYDQSIKNHREDIKEKELNYTRWQNEINGRKQAEAKLQSCMTGEATKYDTLKAALFNLLK